MLNIKDLSNLIKDNLPSENIQLTAEVRQPQLKNHLYLTLKDNHGRINANVWKSKITNDIENLVDGDKVNVEGKLSYYDKGGSLSFNINKLLNVEGKGDLMKQYEDIKSKYENNGYFNKNNKPINIIKNILVLTSEKGAAYKDFKQALDNGNYNDNNININLVDVIVQGVDCPDNIIEYLTTNDVNDYDLIIITRGGGNFEDLFGFCQPELIECVYKLKAPVLSAIGHEIDSPLLDFVADIRMSTPSLAGQYIVDHNNNYKNEIKDRIKNKIKNNIYERLNIINDEKNTFKKSIESIIRKNINDKLKRYNTNIYIMKDNKVLTKDEFKLVLKNKESYSIMWDGELINL